MSDKDVKRSLAVADDIDQPLLSAKEPEISRTSGPGEKRESRKIVSRGLGSHQMLLISGMDRRGPLSDKGQPQVVDDAVDHAAIGEKGDNLHRGATLRAALRGFDPRSDG